MSKWTWEEQEMHRKLWFAALRSGTYNQTRGSLRTSTGFCCLGVGCDVAIKSGEVPEVGDTLLEIKGLCSLGNNDPPKELSVTCKVGDGAYKKDFLGLSDNVTYFAEQLDPVPENTYQYTVVWKPSTIVPNIQIK